MEFITEDAKVKHTNITTINKAIRTKNLESN
jgi:hypothetical protein